jgi:hypothetical protein
MRPFGFGGFDMSLRIVLAVAVVMVVATLVVPCGAFAQNEDGRSGGGSNIDTRKAEIVNKLNTMKVSVDFEDRPLDEVVRTLAEISGIDMLVDRTVYEKTSAEELTLTIKLNDIALKSALKLILGQRNLGCMYKDGVLLVVPKEALDANVVLRIYDVRDLMMRIKDFPGPEITLKVSNDENAGATTGFTIDDESASPVSDPEFIVNTIRSNTGGASWETNPKASVAIANGLLVVNQTEGVQEEIEKLIGLLRQYK